MSKLRLVWSEERGKLYAQEAEGEPLLGRTEVNAKFGAAAVADYVIASEDLRSGRKTSDDFPHVEAIVA